MLLGPEWPARALLRAQLIEEGIGQVVAIDTWPMPRAYRRPGMAPRLLIVDLHGLPAPRAVLEEIGLLIPPGRMLVIAALGTISGEELQQAGYHVLTRPARIGDIVNTARQLLRQQAPRTV